VRSNESLTHDHLRRIPQFADLDDNALDWLAAHAKTYRFKQDENIFHSGDPIDEMFLIIEGGFSIIDNGYVAFRAQAGDISGVLPHSRMTHAGATGKTDSDTFVAGIHRDFLPEMLEHIPILNARLAARMSDRIRDSAKTQQQQEKLASLGKLSAGLAHELNNPAAALARTANALQKRLADLPHLASKPLAKDTLAAMNALLASATPSRLSTLERGEREDELTDYLEDIGLDKAWQLAEGLVDIGLSQASLEPPLDALAEDERHAAVSWLEMLATLQSMSREMGSAAEHIVTLVQSVKTYTHMDRSVDLEPCDVRQGINSTLVMLAHKLRANDITVTSHYPDNVPQVPARVGALNQVWTNLIDNAADAMQDSSRKNLTITLTPEEQYLAVSVADSGSGIPEDIQKKIFEPFFTTKDVGAGTGLGLDVVLSIVKDQHQGTVTLNSQPGETVFTVRLPLEAS
jgi:signal transduction histidine kinase